MSDEQNTPWSALDRIVGAARDFFAAVGLVSAIAFLIGLFWSK